TFLKNSRLRSRSRVSWRSVQYRCGVVVLWSHQPASRRCVATRRVQCALVNVASSPQVNTAETSNEPHVQLRHRASAPRSPLSILPATDTGPARPQVAALARRWEVLKRWLH